MVPLFFHPQLVHLPLALGLLLPFLAAGIWLAWWKTWLPARAWLIPVLLQAVLLLSLGAAMTSGEKEEDRVEKILPEAVLDAHEEAAEGFLWMSAATFALMLAALAAARNKFGLPLAALATLATLACTGAAINTGHKGGELVYRHGAAQAYTTTSPAAKAVDSQDSEKDSPHEEGED